MYDHPWASIDIPGTRQHGDLATWRPDDLTTWRRDACQRPPTPANACLPIKQPSTQRGALFASSSHHEGPPPGRRPHVTIVAVRYAQY